MTNTIAALRSAAARVHGWLSQFALYRVCHALTRLGIASLPWWLRWIPLAAMLIPGPQDEMALLPIFAVALLCTRARRSETFRVARAAWCG